MFERGIIQLLAAWKTDVNRKPLVIHGARQVGFEVFRSEIL